MISCGFIQTIMSAGLCFLFKEFPRRREEGRVKIRQRQRWKQNQDFPTTPSFPLSLSPYLVADGDEHDHFLRLQLLLFFSGWIVINISKQMVHIIVPIQNPFRSLFKILT